MFPFKKKTKSSTEGRCPVCKKKVGNLESHMRIKHLFYLLKRRGRNLRRR